MNETATLAAFVAETESGDVPSEARTHAKQAIRDYVGVAVYGARHEVGDRIAGYVDRCHAGTGASVFAREEASPAGAALANGTFGHAIDYDDTFESIVLHPTSPVFPAALAVGEATDADGDDVLTGYVVGCEAAFRVGHSTYPEHYENGWHSTGTAGSFGAAAAAASVLGLDSEATANALGIVASGSSSLKKNFGTMTKPLHAGHAAEQGVRAALLAADGFTADDAILEGDIGYGEVMTPGDGYDPTEITDNLGGTWAVRDIGYKPYPSGVITHAAMEVLRGLLDEEGLDVDDVARVRVALDDAAAEMLHHERPADALQAKFSIEFCLAAVLLSGDPGVQEFSDEYVTNDEVQEAIRLVDREFEENLFGGRFAGYGARVTVETESGDEHVAEMREAPGSPSNPVDDERLRAKFLECVEARFDRERAEELAECVEELDERPLSAFTDLVRGA
ncbi:MAG: MmgE/PrpD family protein [Halovenus sp.]